MKRHVKLITLLVGAGLTITLRFESAAWADGMPHEGVPAPISAEASARESARLDQEASKTRASLAEDAGIIEVDPEVRSAAIGHYARARSLLIAAIREFDNGYKLAKPDAILNSNEWRSDVISRAEDLERVLAPQAKASKFGVKYEADSRLLAAEAN
jgi:hypothetical protein